MRHSTLPNHASSEPGHRVTVAIQASRGLGAEIGCQAARTHVVKTLGTFVSLIAVIFLVACSNESSHSTAIPNVDSESRTRVYDASADGSKQIAEALVLGKRNRRHVLLQFGGDWCVPCIKLHMLFETNRTISDALQAGYVVVHIEYNERNDHLTTTYHARELGLPFIVIVDADGKHLTTKDSEELAEGGDHSPEKVLAFLNEWTPTALANRQAALRAKPIAQRVQEFIEKPMHADASIEFEQIRDKATEAVPYLIEAITTRPAAMSAEGHANARFRAYHALAAMAPTSAVPLLAEQFISDSQLRDHLRVILIGLGRDANEAVPVLRRALHSTDPDLQCRAAMVLVHLDPGNPELIPTMLAWLKGSNVLTKRAAPMVLGDLGLAAKSAIPALIEASASSDKTVRQRATNAIAKIGGE